MAITISDVADIAETTLAKYDRRKITDIATVEQRHYGLTEFTGERKIVVEGGSDIRFDVITDDNAGARHIGLFDKHQINVKDVHKKGIIPWRRTFNDITFDKMEIAMNANDEVQIQSLADSRYAASFLSFSNKVEAAIWSKPINSTDELTPYGIMYYIVKKVSGASAATGAGEFGGGNPSGFTAGAASIDQGAYANWANWTHTYVDVTDDDLNKKLKLAAWKTDFVSPIRKIVNENRIEAAGVALYMKYEVLAGLEVVAESKNSNLGKDIAPFNGEVAFQRKPLRAVPYLDNDSDNPIYGVNWQWMNLVALQGMELSRSKTEPVAGHPTTVSSNLEMAWNLKCVNRRAQFVISVTADNSEL